MSSNSAISNLRLVSFDGGGIRCFSQLLMLRRLMHSLKSRAFPQDHNRVMHPCEHFDLIGGSDAGGLVAIMLVKLRMSVDEAIEEFGTICEEVYSQKLTPEERTMALRAQLERILVSRGHPIALKLEEEQRSGECLAFVVTASGANLTSKTCLRTYFTNVDRSNVTVIDAALATCASPPEFLPVQLGPTRFERTEHVGAGLGANNPTRRVLAEANSHFGADTRVSLLLSLGSGHPGVLALARTAEDDGLHKLMREMLEDCEKEAEEVRQQMVPFPIYYRLSVVQGLQKGTNPRTYAELGWISAQTTAYLDSTDIKLAIANFTHTAAEGMRPAQGITGSRIQAFRLRELGGLTPEPSIARPSTNPPRYQSIDGNTPRPNEWHSTPSAAACHNQYQEPEAEPRQSNTATQNDNDIEDLHTMNDLALNFQEKGRYHEAESLQAKVLEGRKALLGEEHPDTLDSMQNLAWTYYKQSQYSAAEALQINVWRAREARAGDQSLETLQAMEDLASNYIAQHRWSDAEPLQIRILQAHETLEGPNSATVGTSAHHLAWTYYELGRPADANEFAMKAGTIWAELLKLGVEDPCAKYTTILLQRLGKHSATSPDPVEQNSDVSSPASSSSTGNQHLPVIRPFTPPARAATTPISWVTGFLPQFSLW